MINEIKLINWGYTCSDGCCFSWGTMTILNGIELENDWDDNTISMLSQILTSLNISADISENEENGYNVDDKEYTEIVVNGNTVFVVATHSDIFEHVFGRLNIDYTLTEENEAEND